jgi:serine/threonine-protein kinase
MLTEQGKVKITDFGLAKLTQSSQSHTADDSILGTPLYMSPEQAFGESVDQRSDLFSLGTVLYELLTGRQPFASDNYMGVIQNIINRDVPRPRQLVSDIPPEVEAIAGKALARDRDNRFQSARQFRQRIEQYMGPAQLEATAGRLKVLLETNTNSRELKAPVIEPHQSRGGGRRAAAGIALFAVLAVGTAAILLKPALIERVTGVPAGTLQRADAVDPGVYHFDMSEVIDADHEPMDTTAASGQKPAQTTAAGNGAGGIRTPVEKPEVTSISTDPPVLVEKEPERKPEPEPKPEPVARVGYLSVSSTPAAEVWVDGTYKGDAPVKLELRSGRHSVELRHPNYESYQENLKITSGELSRRSVTMKKMQGSISLATQEGAELFIDGERFGMTPIMRPIVLDAGRHTLSLKKQGYFEWSSEVTIEAKKTLPLKITLSRRY